MDADRIRDWSFKHFEKLILAFVLVASGLLVYRGLQHEDILDSHQPDRLIENARRARAEADQDHNDVVLADRKVELDIRDKRPPIHSGGPLRKIWDPRYYEFTLRRQDPLLMPPLAVQVHGVIAPLAVRSENGEYAIRNLKPAEVIKVEERKRKRPRLPKRRRPQPSELEQMFDEPGLDDPGQGQFAPAGPAERRVRTPLGARPVVTRHIRENTPQKPVPGMGWFIAGTAVVPYQEMHASYEHALGLAKGYAPDRRDRPEFKDYQVQRADVTNKSIDQLIETDWIQRDGRVQTIRDAVLTWSGFAPEIVPADYRADAALTMWIPPVMMTDYATFALHPLIPMESMRAIAERKERLRAMNVPVNVGPDQIRVRDARGRPRGGNERFDEQMQLQADVARMRETRQLPRYKLVRFYDFAEDHADPNAPQQGRNYVYRVRVAVDDPNFPADPRLQPRASTLEPAVYTRISQLVSNIRAADNPLKQRAIDSKRWTPWSKPSASVSLPSLASVALGPARADRIRQVEVGGRLVDHQKNPTKVSVVVSQFDRELKTHVSALLTELTDGTVLSRKTEKADVVDPITLKVKEAAKVEISSKVTVIGVAGGSPLTIHKEDGFLTPSIMLTFGEDGGLQVHEEVDDLERFRTESFADERGK